MSAVPKKTRWSMLAVLVCVLTVTTASSAWAKAEPHPHAGKLPGFPAMRGAVPVLASQAAVKARSKLVGEAFASARAHGSLEQRLFGTRAPSAPVPNELPEAACVSELEELLSFETQKVCYRGGPVARDPKIHLIFWQGKPGASGEEKVQKFPSGYEEIVTRYFEDLADDSGSQTNVFAIDPQYGSESAGSYTPGEYAFQKVEAIPADTSAFPTKCTDKTRFSEGPCLLDSDLHKEVEKYAGATPKGLHDVYVVLTPEGVGGCFEEGECAYTQYCAYHGDFGGDGITPGDQTLYADLPFVGKVPGCDLEGEFGIHPNSAADNGTDAVIDDASHEIGETITDPIGSQCAAGATKPSECELNAWTDAIGQEIADKCLPPESTLAGVYGTPLGDPSKVVANTYNQEINHHHYFTQRQWSNEAGLVEGACVQRRIEARYSVSANPMATVPMTLDGSLSGGSGDPAVYWVWNFGGGEQVGTASPTISHTFATPGVKRVALTVYDAYGNSQAAVEEVTVGAAPPPPPPPAQPTPLSPPAPVVIKEAIVPGHYTAAQVAAALGLPPEGKKLTGFGPFSLGSAKCPPACSATLQLYAKETKLVHTHRTSRLVLVGSASATLSAKGAGPLTLTLNAKGRALLRRSHLAPGKLVVSVEGQEGGSWQITRTLTLASGGKAARERR